MNNLILNLAEILKDRLKEEQLEQCNLLAVPRGDVVTADTVIRRLSSTTNVAVDFDIITQRKLTYPY